MCNPDYNHMTVVINIHGTPEITLGEHVAPILDLDFNHNWVKVADFIDGIPVFTPKYRFDEYEDSYDYSMDDNRKEYLESLAD